MKTVKLNLLIIILGLSFVSVAALPPDMQVDRYSVQVEKALKYEDYDKAAKAMNKIMALKDQHNLKLPIKFYFKYAKVLLKSHTKADEAFAAIDNYLTTTGKNSANYFEALELYTQAESQIEQLKSGYVIIPAGSFRMGDIQGDGNRNEKPVHIVTIPKAFYMSKTEVTQAQWQVVMGNNPSNFKSDNHPVERVSWDDIQGFIARLNQQTGKRYRLPSEAEWEYATRAGSATKYSWGNYISHGNANYGNRWKKTSPAAGFAPNAWGLYDMVGNVWEWTQDCWHGDYDNAPTNGSAWKSKDGGNCARRVLRGGSWGAAPDGLRSAFRFGYAASRRSNSYGFRLVQDK